MTFPWRTALFISVALNLIVVSAAVGAFLSGARLEQPAPEAAEEPQLNDRLAGQRAFMMALPPETRATLRRELGRDVIAMRAQRTAAREARIALFQAARTEPYDAARVRAAFAAVRQADMALLEGFHNSLSDALGRIEPAERAAALDALGRRQPATEDGAPPDDLAPLGPGVQRPQLSPEERRERREQFRERMRERREQRHQPAP